MPRATPLLLLPGMDGTGRLFAPLLAHLPSTIAARVLDYPADDPLGYDELLPRARAALPAGSDFVILGESFSGPLALRLAAERPTGLRGVILAASFVASPMPWVPAWSLRLAAPLAFGAPGLRMAASALGVGECDPELTPLFHAANAAVARSVLVRRARAILELDLRSFAPALATLPTLVLAARRDRVVGPAHVAAILRMLPHARIVWLDAPHLLLQAAPAPAAAEIERFVEAVIPV